MTSHQYITNKIQVLASTQVQVLIIMAILARWWAYKSLRYFGVPRWEYFDILIHKPTLQCRWFIIWRHRFTIQDCGSQMWCDVFLTPTATDLAMVLWVKMVVDVVIYGVAPLSPQILAHLTSYIETGYVQSRLPCLLNLITEQQAASPYLETKINELI